MGIDTSLQKAAFFERENNQQEKVKTRNTRLKYIYK